MKMTIDNLKKAGAFTGKPVQREVVWEQHGKELKADVFVRRLSYHSAVSELKAFTDKEDFIAARIAGCICDAKGKPVFTIGDITGASDPSRGPLDSALSLALFNVIAEVNGLGEEQPEQKN